MGGDLLVSDSGLKCCLIVRVLVAGGLRQPLQERVPPAVHSSLVVFLDHAWNTRSAVVEIVPWVEHQALFG